MLGAVLLAPGVLAHGDEAPTTFDPLVLGWPLVFDNDGLVEKGNDGYDSDIPFPATSPAARGSPLAFSYRAPVKHQLGQGLELVLSLRAASPIVTQDAEGNSFELTLLVGAAPLQEATKRVAIGTQVMAPGDVATIRATLQAPSTTFDEGALVTLTLTPLIAALPDDALYLVPSGSSAMLQSMRVPTVADLQLQTTNLTQFDTAKDAFVPREANAKVIVGLVRHDTIDLSDAVIAAGQPTYLVLKGDEDAHTATDNHGFATRDARVDAAHELRVGTVLVRVMPGIGVALPMTPGTSVKCLRNCPEDFTANFTAGEPAVVPTSRPTLYEDARDTLVPPPPATGGVPVSKDKPAEKRALALPAAFVIAALCAATLWRRRV